MATDREDQKIMLDSSSFKALASETRVLILKELDKKRSTASETAKALGISVQAASEHLENLRVAGLVERSNDGRKWVYFTLTEKGQAVLHPESGKRLWVLLSILFLAVASGGVFYLTQAPASQQAFQTGSQNVVFATPPQNENPGAILPASAEKALTAPASLTSAQLDQAAGNASLNQTNSTP